MHIVDEIEYKIVYVSAYRFDEANYSLHIHFKFNKLHFNFHICMEPKLWWYLQDNFSRNINYTDIITFNSIKDYRIIESARYFEIVVSNAQNTFIINIEKRNID